MSGDRFLDKDYLEADYSGAEISCLCLYMQKEIGAVHWNSTLQVSEPRAR